MFLGTRFFFSDELSYAAPSPTPAFKPVPSPSKLSWAKYFTCQVRGVGVGETLGTGATHTPT